MEDFVNDSGDTTDDPIAFASAMRGNLSTLDGELMLACCWASDESRQNFDMFPEVLGGDNTEQINAEERCLYTCIGFNNKNKVFPVLSAFLPAKSQWAYSWTFKHAFPLLHPGTGCKYSVHILTDASPKETRAIENVCGQCSPMKINHDFQMQVMDGVDGTESILHQNS